MYNHNGILIVVEGINGAGKTTVIEGVVNHYKFINRSVVVYKFPDRNGKYGKRIDDYLKGIITIPSKYDILQLFTNDRLLVKDKIEQDLNNGKIVICDRYVFSAIAYHIPRHITSDKIIKLYCNVIGYFDKTMPIPDIVYLIEGNHLHKRGSIVEIFHDLKCQELQNLKKILYKVISNYTLSVSVLKNYTDKSDDVVNYIINDINAYLT